MPMFYRVAAVVFIEPHFNIDELGGGQYFDDNEEDVEGCNGDNEGYSDENSDGYTDEDGDEDGYNTKVLSNIRPIRGAGQVNTVREMRIVMQGKAQKMNDLISMLNNAGLGGSFMEAPTGGGQSKNMKALNKLLSRALPSLCEISLHGDGVDEQYGCIPIQQLIMQRLRGPKQLRALKIVSDCALCFDDYDDFLDKPVALERMYTNCEGFSGTMEMPAVLASNLVELSFSSTSVNHIWDDFEVDSGDRFSRLELSRLRSLNLNISMEHGLVDHMSSLSILGLQGPQESQESLGYLKS
ncbi:hypothetical protein GGH94_002995 [Coemansia aciculifera]|uniref:Uncharacterized protein n=1 Tax=Coemansia aciculifera TaxID=417176 RepID=A0A9W8IIA4_9FUNG|nr:hypothetical protein GGH94_002995 [Coemansia aciculifera]